MAIPDEVLRLDQAASAVQEAIILLESGVRLKVQAASKRLQAAARGMPVNAKPNELVMLASVIGGSDVDALVVRLKFLHDEVAGLSRRISGG